MRRLLRFLLIFVVVIIGAALIAPNFIPMGVYKSQIIRAAENTTGRVLAINGDLSIAFFPRIQIELNDVTFANRQGASPTEMATMDKLSIGLAVMPLLRREVVIERFVLERPVMVLELDSRGRGNWEFGITQPTDESEGGESSEAFALNEVSLGDVRLVDGDVSFRDGRSGAQHHFQDIDLTVSLPTLQGALGLDGQLTYNGERLSLDTEITSPRGFIDGEATPVEMALRSDVMRFDFNGTAASASGGALPIRANGDVELDVPSVRRFSAWTGSAIESPGGFGPFHVTGQVDANGDRVRFSNARLLFDEMEGSGNFSLNLGGARPRITGDLALNKVDVRPYVAGDGAAPTPRGSASSEWSTAPIDLSALRAFDADLDIVADEIITPTLNMGRSTLDLTLRNGVMTALIEEMSLYEGSGTARFEVDARNPTIVIREQSTFSVIQALPLFRDLANFSSLEGVGNITVDLTTRGRSQRDFISALNGSGEIRFNDGALKGINIASLVRTVGSALTDIDVPGGPQQTDFAELGGTFQIRNGVLSNLDMRLLNPLLRITGAGDINLVERTMEYRIDPQAVMTLEGQGSTRDITGMTVPLLISGSWDNLQFGPDVGAIGQRFLGNILGGGQAPSQEPAEEDPDAEAQEEQIDPADAILRNLFGGGGTREAARPEEDDNEPAEEEQPEEEDEEEAAPPTTTPEDILRRLLEGN